MAIQSVQRALQILSLFSKKNAQLGVNEISALVNLPKTTAHGLIRTLLAENFLKQDTLTKKYSLGMKIHELGSSLVGDLAINRFGARPAKQLAEKVRHMVRLAVWDQNSVLVTLSLAPEPLDSNLHQLEPRLPAHCTALGKAILASLPKADYLRFLEETEFTPFTPKTQTEKSFFREEIKQVQFSGFATESEEYRQDLSCIAAPIRDHIGQCAGAISLSDAPGILSIREREKNIESLLATALEISRLMGYSP